MLAGRALAAQGATGHQGDIVHLGCWGPGQGGRAGPRGLSAHTCRAPPTRVFTRSAGIGVPCRAVAFYVENCLSA